MVDIEQVPTIELLNELTRRYACLNKPESRYILLGAPGSGKGTQSNILRRSHCLCHISTGDMLREAVALKTAAGLQAKEKMDKGDLVNDEIVLGLLDEKLKSSECRRGFVLDGFPRNISQAQSLNALLSKNNQNLDGVLYFDVPEEVLTTRVCGRRVHPPSGRVYHTAFNPPKVEGKDDVTGEPLVLRKDDNEDTLRRRLKTFQQETLPLVDYYSKLGLLHKVNGEKPSSDVTKRLYDIVDKRAAS